VVEISAAKPVLPCAIDYWIKSTCLESKVLQTVLR